MVKLKHKRENRPHPEPLELTGLRRDFEEITDQFAGNWDVIDKNKVAYKKNWAEYLPETVHDLKRVEMLVHSEHWTMDDNPRKVCRKVMNENSDLPAGKSEYFILMLNQKNYDASKRFATLRKHQMNGVVLDPNMVMGEVGKNFYLCPNINPYHKYDSLLITKDSRRQEGVTKDDVKDWMVASILTGQRVYFNSKGAGASKFGKFHAHMVDPEELKLEGKIVEYPIFNSDSVRQVPVPGYRDVSKLEGYCIDALVFTGRKAPHKVAGLVDNLESEQIPFNIIVNGNQALVVARSKSHERAVCMGMRLGGYGICGVLPLGNVHETALAYNQVRAEEVFNHLDYKTIESNIRAGTLPLNVLVSMLNRT